MVALNFSVFQDKILAGDKCQTIRRTARCKPGDRLQLYTGLRTKASRKLGDAICTGVVSIRITDTECAVYDGHIQDSPCGLPGSRDLLAKEDGFDSYQQMKDFFRSKYGLPFEGKLVMWRDFVPAGKAVA